MCRCKKKKPNTTQGECIFLVQKHAYLCRKKKKNPNQTQNVLQIVRVTTKKNNSETTLVLQRNKSNSSKDAYSIAETPNFFGDSVYMGISGIDDRDAMPWNDNQSNIGSTVDFLNYNNHNSLPFADQLCVRFEVWNVCFGMCRMFFFF